VARAQKRVQYPATSDELAEWMVVAEYVGREVVPSLVAEIKRLRRQIKACEAYALSGSRGSARRARCVLLAIARGKFR
jgi:hypothetical protein